MALSEDQIIDLFNDARRETFNGLERFRYFARAIEAEVRNSAQEEAAKAVEKATYSKRWAKAAVNSHPDDVPPCEFAALIRAMKEPTP